MDLCFPALRSAGYSHCNDCVGPVSILVFKSKTKQNQMVGFWPFEYTQEQNLEKTRVRTTKVI